MASERHPTQNQYLRSIIKFLLSSAERKPHSLIAASRKAAAA
ncbi:hypothetical protein CCACVL1_10821 [Corchorus capsularis]|uniref:Uncharacterized protein n=1 Tax=Corchorus capsularis TaxID=210143 RepID=A0A1R3IPE2_COCAP|nr:hypothetical protein CCACVL1_10821 [Corchorus capsularis]